jgi:hypothetical protein
MDHQGGFSMDQAARSQYEAQSVQHYAREVRPHLSTSVFEPSPMRLLWLPLHLAVIGALAAYVVLGERRGTRRSPPPCSPGIAGGASASSRTRLCITG